MAFSDSDETRRLLVTTGTQRTEREMTQRTEREMLLATIGTRVIERIPHRPKERVGPNQCLRITKLPMSLMCDYCGNCMPKCSKIAVIRDASITAQRPVGSTTWTKMHYDCTNPNCTAEITVKRKGFEIVVESGATPYFRPEDEKLEYFPKSWTISPRISQGNPASHSSQASCNQGVTRFDWSMQLAGVTASSSSSVAASSSSVPSKDDMPRVNF